MVLVQKWPFFQLLFLSQCRPVKCFFYDILEKKRLSRLYNQEVQIVEEVDIFPKR